MVARSQPYAPGASVYWTNYTYDGLGRTIQVTAADGASHTNYAYYGSTTVVTDPAGNWKAMTTDVDGNLKSVIEPDPAYNPSALTSAQTIDCVSMQAPSGMMGTCYTYDVMKNLTAVRMPRSNGTQTRSFTYQAGTNWLLSATNPENGTVTYSRDAMGNVTQRVDAMGQTTNYTYDSYHRLTQVTRGNDPCQSESYFYDQSIDSTFASGASWGKLTGVLFGFGTPGTGVCPGTGSNGSTWSGLTYEYQYASSGRTTGKRMIVQRQSYNEGMQQYDLDAYWTYDNEGRVLSVQYPVVTDPGTGNPTSTAYNYTYDNMGRPSTMPNGYGGYNVNGVSYNASDQLLSIGYFGTGENRSYNAMNQLTYLASGAMVENYLYTAGQNNGQISEVQEGSGETVSYQYDRLKRLISASSTLGWSQQYTYDGFGNMTYKSGNFSAYADPATNRLIVASYDANGNMYQGNWNYDVENRLVGVDAGGGERYMYDPSNKRVYKQYNSGETYWFYGVDGRVLGEYAVDITWQNSGTLALDLVTESAYFGGKKVLPSVGRDRLGSVRTSGAANHPYGENYSSQNTDGFGAYYQDSSTALNYADQRYYNATFGRFISPDRFENSGGPRDPRGWNQYAYAEGDPVNGNDPTGRSTCWVDSVVQDENGVGKVIVDCLSRGATLDGQVTYDISQPVPPDPTQLFQTYAKQAQQDLGRQLDQQERTNVLLDAYVQAEKDLDNNTPCQNLYGTAQTRSNGWDPAVVLANLFWGTNNLGHIGYGPTLGALALTVPTLAGGALGAAISVSGSATWLDMQNSDQALVLLHELGHAYNILIPRGSGGSQISQYDFIPWLQDNNNDLVYSTCGVVPATSK
jgi:RHS repeat-associated protein